MKRDLWKGFLWCHVIYWQSLQRQNGVIYLVRLAIYLMNNVVQFQQDIAWNKTKKKYIQYKFGLFGKVLDIFDSDGNGAFDMDDVPKIVDKTTEFGCSLIYLQIEMLKTIATACVLPTLNLGFHMFTEDGTVSLEMVKMLVAGDDDNDSDDDASLEMVSVTVSP